MPIDPNKRDAIRANLQRIANGEKPPLIVIGELTQKQFADINAYRSAEQLPALESAVVVYQGRHHYESRSKDGYTIEDMVLQIESALSAHSEVVAGKKMTGIQNKQGRNDGLWTHRERPCRFGTHFKETESGSAVGYPKGRWKIKSPSREGLSRAAASG